MILRGSACQLAENYAKTDSVLKNRRRSSIPVSDGTECLRASRQNVPIASFGRSRFVRLLSNVRLEPG